jgi:hypothetical protein
MDYRPIDEESLEPMGPYVGLRPYEESHRHIFFGREEERDILIDKLIANKLTLLFAATGVGKSSLLRAGVIPALKHKKKEGLDVVYYCDWVSDPLVHLKKETVAVLQAQNKIAGDYPLYRETEDISLKKFFRLAAAFASEPLVVILDQFEEFFQYRRYKENFIKFIAEFSECVNDRERQVVFLVSMREDFALELNVFKKYLPTMLFENYYRLEKLNAAKAGEAIVKPVERFGFQYEEKLLEALLKDLAQREKEAQWGASPAALVQDAPAYVELSYLQIVCSRLWEADRQNPERKIRDENTDSYNEEKLKDWNKRLKEVEPNEPLEFELAFALSRIDPFHEGTKLLGHPLTNVREGAWLGLGKSRDVSLIEILYRHRKQSDIPWFIHAAYRAIDHILMNLEAFGGKEELNQLETLYKKLSAEEGKNFHEGVQTRMEWTIERLRELDSKK